MLITFIIIKTDGHRSLTLSWVSAATSDASLSLLSSRRPLLVLVSSSIPTFSLYTMSGGSRGHNNSEHQWQSRNRRSRRPNSNTIGHSTVLCRAFSKVLINDLFIERPARYGRQRHISHQNHGLTCADQTPRVGPRRSQAR
ncbi:hypothetical protein P879_09044 [Paragonimus westermani]|uniref:Uncharacterized protein n=1 Tax=Paragonimus westermani TaxID=34504 RepID=A0A8T0DNM4_9TREM|nr:hypothetical protein P879_09044 [Paragonimus westermani]